ncbi:putative endoglucanase celA [Streptomyces viridochromogenes Tue57]|uniref:Putative endoglucanase celA n=1 Tax=Streptomyces viridochromogenes Tue57 TaxID=1160705 RepID=L8PR62_STRVR|nr:putative endoglucanase celA [Streptomyces viridochromogenes Tue57]
MVALVAAVTVPVVTAQGATPACTVDAKWSRSGTTVTAANENWNGALGTGGSVSAGVIASLSGGIAAPTAFRLNGTTRRLLGVDRSGGEFVCVQGNGIWDGPVDGAPVGAIADWNVNTVRIPLNEECRLGLPHMVKAHGMPPMPALHWSWGRYTGNSAGCSDVHATCRKPMPNARYTPAFRESVAGTFKCRRGGGGCPGTGYEAAGMQDLVDAVRDTGARNLILLGGLAYSNDLGQWLTYRPTGPAGNLAAAWHVCDFNACTNESCRNSDLAPVAAQVPLVAGEIGENTCAHPFVDRVMKWFDDRGLSYLGWTRTTWSRSSGPALISSYDGTPTAYGIGLRGHLRVLDG